jgi:hypothetical protein
MEYIEYLSKYLMLKTLIALLAVILTVGLGVLMILAQHWIIFRNDE